MKSVVLMIWAVIAAGVVIWDIVRPAHAQTVTPWFSVTVGETTCKAWKVSQTPIHVGYSCSNQYGGTAGSYTANGTGGSVAPDVFTISLQSAPPAAIPSGVTCLIGMNATANPVNAGSLGTIPPNSANYSCAGNSGSGTISWP